MWTRRGVMRRPRPGDIVQLRYGVRYRSLTAYHKRVGKVLCVARGHKMVNALIQLGTGELVVVPSGNLFDWGEW